MAAGESGFSKAYAILPAGMSGPDAQRQRYPWMYDDEDIWGADTGGFAPPVTSGDDWRAPRV
jgi:hypothetical protein